MTKKVINKIKLQVEAGKANPAPPVGTALGPAGINIQEFCTRYNDATRDKMGDVLPVEISIYEDRSFDFIIKTPPAAFLIKKALGLKKGGQMGANDTVGTLTDKQLTEIAEQKLVDLNAYDVDQAKKIIAGTAHNMGVILEGETAVVMTEAEKAARAAELEAANAPVEVDNTETVVEGAEPETTEE